jgi:hypothetical protein
MNAGGGAAVRQLGSQVGLGEEQTASALSALVPALAAGFQRNIQTPEGAASLMTALLAGNHQRYLENPTALADQAAVSEGNGILGHVLGSKDVSRHVASRAAAQTGLSDDVLKRLLPLAASVVMAALAQQKAGGGAASGTSAAGGGGIADMLSSLVDRDRDGSIADDLTNMKGRALGGRS